MKETDNEPLDGDATSDFCKDLNFELDLLNGNETIENKKNQPRYTMIRCNNESMAYGKSHGSDDAETTCCGIDIINDAWIITHNQYDGYISCPKCLKKINA
jgi:hypothetical protein